MISFGYDYEVSLSVVILYAIRMDQSFLTCF